MRSRRSTTERIPAPTAACHVGCATAYPNVNTPDDQRPEMPRSGAVPDPPRGDTEPARLLPHCTSTAARYEYCRLRVARTTTKTGAGYSRIVVKHLRDAPRRRAPAGELVIIETAADIRPRQRRRRWRCTTVQCRVKWGAGRALPFGSQSSCCGWSTPTRCPSSVQLAAFMRDGWTRGGSPSCLG